MQQQTKQQRTTQINKRHKHNQQTNDPHPWERGKQGQRNSIRDNTCGDATWRKWVSRANKTQNEKEHLPINNKQHT